jgi:hypothetical protein
VALALREARNQVDNFTKSLRAILSTMQVLSEEYVAASISSSMAEAVLDVEGDLLAIESSFGQIGEMFERIESFRRQLEARVRNTIKYAERGAHGLVGHAGDIVAASFRLRPWTTFSLSTQPEGLR